MKRLLIFSLALITAGLLNSNAADAQLDFLRSLFGPRQPAPRVFAGDAQLDAARQAAQRGEVKESLELVRTAMSKGAAQFPLNDPLGQMVSLKLLSLCREWERHHADPAAVAATLQEIVLPKERPQEIWPYAASWQREVRPWDPTETRLPAPESVASEMVEWSVRSRQTDSLRKRLVSVLPVPNAKPIAEVVAVQLAVAEKNHAAAIAAMESLQQATGNTSLVDEWMLHAVHAGMQSPETRFAGLKLLEAILESAGKPEGGTLADVSYPLIIRAIPHYFALDRKDDAIRLAMAAAHSPLAPQRYNDDLATHIQQTQRSQAAACLLDGHCVKEALAILAERADTPSSRLERYYPSVNIAAMLGRELQRLPAEERYSLLHHWTMPDEQRPTCRELTEFVPDRQGLPGDTAETLPAAGILRDVYSTSWHLVSTARELERLDELLAEFARLPSNQPDINIWQTLALVMRDGEATDPVRSARTTQRLLALLEETTANIPKWEDEPKRPLPMLTCVVALEAARFPQWSQLSEELLQRLIEHSQRLQWDRPRPHLRMAWAEVQRRRTAAETSPAEAVAAIPREWRDLQPRHWIASGAETALQHAGGSLDDVWIAHADSFYHMSGRFDSSLFFEFPLTGEFTLSMDVREGGWSEGAAGYGGVFFATNGYVDRAPLHDPGRSNFLQSPPLVNLLHRNPWNHQSIEVRNGIVRYRANGQLIHEDQPGNSSPWLSLNADWGRTPIYRNMRFTGTPVIPAEVRLLDDHRLRGWIATTFSESRDNALRGTPAVHRTILPRREMGLPLVTNPAADGNNAPGEITMETDWYWDRDELRSGQRKPFLTESVPSRLHYHRPLRPGESVEYEFFLDPDACEAHPTVGQTLFVILPQQVIVRPLGDGGVEVRQLTGNESTSPHRWNLKPGDWNRARVVLDADSVILQVNEGEPVTLPLVSHNDTEFGFWHDAARTSLRVREVVLRGEWPKTFTEKFRSAIERPQPRTAPSERQFLTDILREEVIADNAYAVYQTALKLDGEARYDYLYQWVMPGPDHDTIRTAGALTPTHPSPLALVNNPIDGATAEVRQQIDQRRVQTGGSFVCPAVLLIFSALELGRLGELSDALDRPLTVETPAAVRARTAMHGMIALLEDRIDHAKAALWDCNRLLLEGGGLPQPSRWSEPALCSLAILHPDTREAAFELLDRIQRRQIQSGQPGIPEFYRYVRHLHGHALFLLEGGEPAEFGTQPRLKQWHAVSQAAARTRGAGYPVASFDTLGRALSLRGGHELDMAYFQSPLRGNFEVRMSLTHFDYREFMPLVGGFANVVKYDSKTMKLQPLLGPVQEMPIGTEIVPRARSWGDYRIVVEAGRYTSSVSGQKLYEQDLPPGSDPWIAIQGLAGYSSRIARNVSIHGQPEIPEELDLLAPPDLQGWQVDYFAPRVGESPYAWRRDGEELTCDQVVMRGNTEAQLKVENILRYHRPMLEDGVITYEFYFDPDAKTADTSNSQRQTFSIDGQAVNWLPSPYVVHPALDRMVCLFDPEGIKLHWLTDGRFDRTGVLPDNVTIVAGAKPLPLKPQDWNAVQLAVTGDELTIRLNGKEVFRHPIEATNQRHFGLFHFVNESKVRVRQIRYRGEWPKSLPPVEEQELAVGPERDVDIPDADLPARIEYDLTRTPLDPQKFAYIWDSKIARFIRGTPAGFRLTFPAGEDKKATVAGFAPRVRVKGDFIATVDYSGLTTVPVKTAWGCGLSFKLRMQGSYDAGFEVRRTTTGQALNCVWQMPVPGGSTVYYAENFSAFPEAGRLRLVRRGHIVYFLMAEPGSDDFRLLTTRPLGTTEIDRIGPQVDCSDAAGGADVLIERIEIRAQELVPYK